MQWLLTALCASGLAAMVAACGGGSAAAGSTLATTTTVETLAAGTTATLAANTSVMVPAGTVVTAPNGTVITINGSSNMVSTEVGAVVNVPGSATGPANNTISTGQPGGSGTSSALPTVSALAGSATTNLSPVDGTGASAVFWGGGHLAISTGGNVILSDRGSLRQIAPEGVVTTLLTPSQASSWDGIALDAQDDVFGSDEGGSLVSTAPASFDAALYELTPAGGLQTLFPDWESATSNPDVGSGGIAVDIAGNLYLADAMNNRIVKFVKNGSWTVLAGSGAAGNQDGVGTAATFTFSGSEDLAIDTNDFLYVRSLDTIRKISPDGVVTTIVSGLSPGSTAMATDQAGNLYTAAAQTIYKIESNGTVTAYPFHDTTDFITSLTTDSTGKLFAGTRGTGAQVFDISF